MNRWDLVIFDLDGTLLDTIGDLGTAVNHALEARRLPLHTMDEYKCLVGHGIRNLVQASLPGHLQGDESLVDECLADFRSYYTAHIDVQTHPYEGMVELVTGLCRSGVKLAVASNKFQEGTERLVAEFFPGIDFTAVFGNSPELPLKPDARVVEMIVDRAGVDRSRCVMVGDSRTDMTTAANGGIAGIAVSWGFRPRADLAACAPAVADTPDELSNLLLQG